MRILIHPLRTKNAFGSAAEYLRTALLWGAVFCLGLTATCWSYAAELVTYSQVRPILDQYCAGCHGATDPEGDFSVASYDSLMADSRELPAIVPGQPEKSHLWQLLTGAEEPRMPPEDEVQPSGEEIKQLRQWILDGADNDSASPMRLEITAPQLPTAPRENQFASTGCSLPGNAIAIGRFGRVDIYDAPDTTPQWSLEGFSGKVNSLRTSADGKQLVVGSGVTGVAGEIAVIDISSRKIIQRLQGHSDAVYCASLSPDGKWIASGSYDRKVILWDVATGKAARELTGHNGAIYDLDFDAQSKLLATASGDQTVKLWQVATGLRLDTFGQPEGEMYCVRFAPDAQHVFAAGADRQIRCWQIVSSDKPAINPMLHARYAHESTVLQLEFVNAGQLVSTSADLTAKLWQAEELKSLGQLAELADVPVAILTRTHKAAADNSDLRIQVLQITGQSPWLASPLLGKHQTLAEETSTPTSLLLEASAPATQPKTAPQARPPAPHDFTEVEPNNSVAEATRISLPAKVAGAIAGVDAVGNEVDADYFKFSAQAGEQWIFEVMASRNGSPLDSRIEVLGMDSQSLLRTRLQAVRESYFTFRGKDSATSDDFRLHKWEDMELDEYFYAEGEVSRLWLYPRGPDSGFKVYPGVGSRRTYFDTTPVSHALGATGYIVRELALAEQPLPNGLPVFPIYFENDDDPFRRHGADSRLEFVAPATADYIARVRDARGFSGDDFKYELEIRRPKPDFSLSVGNSKLSMPIGSGREWSVTATRSDGLEGPICIALEGVPNGFLATNPLIIEAGQERAFGTLYATPAAAILPDTSSNQEPTEDGSNALANAAEGAQEVATTMPPEPFVIKLIASSEVAGQRIEHELNETLEVTLVERSELQFQIVDATDSNREVEELSIRPGETISARILIQRQGVESRVSFGGDDSGRNLPHGAYVDNIGLNGLLIPEGQNEREFFITAAPKLQPGRRQFHLQNDSAGKATSRPLWLNVLPPQAKLDPSDSETR